MYNGRYFLAKISWHARSLTIDPDEARMVQRSPNEVAQGAPVIIDGTPYRALPDDTIEDISTDMMLQRQQSSFRAVGQRIGARFETQPRSPQVHGLCAHPFPTVHTPPEAPPPPCTHAAP